MVVRKYFYFYFGGSYSKSDHNIFIYFTAINKTLTTFYLRIYIENLNLRQFYSGQLITIMQTSNINIICFAA